MIGITGVTGKLGSYVADLVDKKGIASIQEAQSVQKSTRQRKFVRWCMPILQRWLRP